MYPLNFINQFREYLGKWPKKSSVYRPRSWPTSNHFGEGGGGGGDTLAIYRSSVGLKAKGIIKQ